MPFYDSLAKINSNRCARPILVITYTSIFSKNFCGFLPDTNGFQPEIVKRYKKGIDYLKQARNIEELFLLPSLHYEVLKGDKAGVSSIRVNDHYRIEFTVEQVSEPIVVTICNIIELSNHYKWYRP